MNFPSKIWFCGFCLALSLLTPAGRAYAPSLGRYFGQDKQPWSVENTNAHAYVQNEPTTQTDPTGAMLYAPLDYARPAASIQEGLTAADIFYTRLKNEAQFFLGEGALVNFPGVLLKFVVNEGYQKPFLKIFNLENTGGNVLGQVVELKEKVQFPDRELFNRLIYAALDLGQEKYDRKFNTVFDVGTGTKDLMIRPGAAAGTIEVVEPTNTSGNLLYRLKHSGPVRRFEKAAAGLKAAAELLTNLGPQFAQRIPRIASNLWDNPEKFVNTLVGGFQNGLKKFFPEGNATGNLKEGVSAWLFGDLREKFKDLDIPKEAAGFTPEKVLELALGVFTRLTGVDKIDVPFFKDVFGSVTGLDVDDLGEHFPEKFQAFLDDKLSPVQTIVEKFKDLPEVGLEALGDAREAAVNFLTERGLEQAWKKAFLAFVPGGTGIEEFLKTLEFIGQHQKKIEDLALVGFDALDVVERGDVNLLGDKVFQFMQTGFPTVMSLAATQLAGVSDVPGELQGLIGKLDVPGWIESGASALYEKIKNDVLAKVGIGSIGGEPLTDKEEVKKDPSQVWIQENALGKAARVVLDGHELSGQLELLDVSGKELQNFQGQAKDLLGKYGNELHAAKKTRLELRQKYRAAKKAKNTDQVKQLGAQREALTKSILKLKTDAKPAVKHLAKALHGILEAGRRKEGTAKVPSGGWGGYLEKNEPDILKQRKEKVSDMGLWNLEGEAKEKKVHVHAHHVVMKGNRFRESFYARQILRRAGIQDPFTDLRNFVWGPNWKHSQRYASFVLSSLKPVQNKGEREVEKVLRDIASRFIKGDFGKEALPGDEDDDT